MDDQDTVADYITASAYTDSAAALAALESFAKEVREKQGIVFDKQDLELVEQTQTAFSTKLEAGAALQQVIEAQYDIFRRHEKLAQYFPHMMRSFARRLQEMIDMRKNDAMYLLEQHDEKI